ncbi:MAG: DAHL domain-containing protein [Candidatus Competibacterales bacterium]
MRWRIVVDGLVILVGLGALGWLYGQSYTLDLDRHLALTGLFQELQTADTRWNEAVMRTRYSLFVDDEPIDQGHRALVALEAKLAQQLALGWQGGSLSRALAAYREAFQAKADLVEDFQGGAALLRDALAQLPKTVARAKSRLQGQDAQGAVQTTLDALQVALLSYGASLDPAQGDAARQHTATLRAQQTRLKAASQDAIASVANYAGVVLSLVPAVNAQVEAIGSAPTTTNLARLFAEYYALHRLDLAATEDQQWLLLALSTALLGYLILVGLRLNRSYRSLDCANTQLTKAKESLEQRVADRTRELRDSQAQLIQAEKMASLGQMVAGVTHEINTPLAYVRSNTALVLEQWPALAEFLDQTLESRDKGLAQRARQLKDEGVWDDIAELLSVNLAGLDRLGEMVKNLKNFSRLDRQQAEDFDLNQGLDQALTIANYLLKNRVTVVRDYHALPPVKCIPSKLNQVFLNLVVNAAQAIEGQGTLVLRSRIQDDTVTLFVEDDGQGIPEDLQGKIFDPFFTTKPVGEGTGLGLAIAYQVVKEHGGRIEVSSAVGVGTCFIIALPVAGVRKDAA